MDLFYILSLLLLVRAAQSQDKNVESLAQQSVKARYSQASLDQKAAAPYADVSEEGEFEEPEEDDVDPSEVPAFLKIAERRPIAMSEERLAAALAWARQKVAGYRELEKAPSGANDTSRITYHRLRFDAATQRAAREALAWVEAARAPAQLGGWRGGRTTCPALEQPDCEAAPRFRRQDGACNHGRFPLRGAADTPLVRLAPDTFDDGVNAPRSRGRDGSPLRSAREISQAVLQGADDVNPALTLSVVNWGQFMDHDVTLSPPFLTEDGAELDCCRDGQAVTDGAHPQCFPIEIPADDPFYGSRGQRCMEFARSVPAFPPDCRPGPTITTNVLTAFVDGSGVYGSRTSRASLVRSFSGGRLKVQRGNLLPRDPPGIQIATEQPCFSPDEETRPCFLAGDVRATEQSGLFTMHTIWMREHNRVARELERVNPRWDDERLFQEARKIVGAELQHITYNEWLPLLVGEEFMRQNDMETEPGDRHSRRYSPLVDPTIATEFSTAAFRVGHTLIQGRLELYGRVQGDVTQAVNLRDVFFDPSLIYDGKLGEFAVGMVTQHPQRCDANIVEDLTEFLFQEEGHDFGLDLISLNIQRGRDHGIATYNTMRELIGLPRAERFRDLRDTIPRPVIRRLRSVYSHVDDIDLFVGAVSETVAPGAAVGPTIQAIVGDQFGRLRWGDNFFYDLGGRERPWRFSRRQLRELKNVTWARVLCDNIRRIRSIQPKAFQAAGDGNEITDCRQLPRMDLNAWRGRGRP